MTRKTSEFTELTTATNLTHLLGRDANGNVRLTKAGLTAFINSLLPAGYTGPTIPIPDAPDENYVLTVIDDQGTLDWVAVPTGSGTYTGPDISVPVTGEAGYRLVADATGGTAWEEIPAGGSSLTLASSAESLAGTLDTVAAHPKGVADYVKQFGWGAVSLTNAANLNSITTNSLFAYANTTTNAPAGTSGFGRGFTIFSSSNFATQFAIENGTGDLFARFLDNGTWSNWSQLTGAAYTGPVIDPPTEAQAGYALLAGATAGSTYWGSVGSSVVAAPTAGEVGYQLLAGAGGTTYWAEIVSGGGGSTGDGPLTAVLSADVNTTGLTPLDVFEFTVEANKVYKIQVSYFYNATSTSIGLGVAIDGTVGLQSLGVRVSGLDATGGNVVKYINSKGTQVIFDESFVPAANNLLEFSGLIYTTASGTLKFQFAAAVEYEYIAIQKGSGGMLQELGSIA